MAKKVTTWAVYHKEYVCLVSAIKTHWINTNSSQHQYYKTRSKPGLINFKVKIDNISALKDKLASEIAAGCKTGLFLGFGFRVWVLLKMILIITSSISAP